MKHIVVLSRFQFFTFKTLRARSTLEEWGDKACIASLFLSPLLSRSLLPTLSPVRVFPSHKGSQQPFFLIRQRRHCIFPTTLSTRVNNNARKKHAREHCYLATPSFLLSLFSFFFFTISSRLLNSTYVTQISCTKHPIVSPPPFSSKSY